MLIDLDNLIWMDVDDSNEIYSFLVMGFSEVADILSTRYVIDNKLCSRYDSLNPDLKYTAVFNGRGNTFDEMKESIESEFSVMKVPELFPIVGQSDKISELKKLSIKFLELQYGASRMSKKELDRFEKSLAYKDRVLSELTEYYMNIFSYKNNYIN